MVYASYYVNFYLENCINIIPIEKGSKNPKYAWKQYQETKFEEPDLLRDTMGNSFCDLW